MSAAAAVFWLILFCVFCVFATRVSAHGRMLEPPGRSTAWRFNGKQTPVNYDDHSLNCGGFYAQHYQNNHKCGVCGDNFALPRPRPNEFGGKFGSQTVPRRKYFAGSTINLTIEITAFHKGYFRIDLCNDAHNETEECFRQIWPEFHDIRLGMNSLRMPLPNNLTCDKCVLRWHYECGNNWGKDQENFRACSDISIVY